MHINGDSPLNELPTDKTYFREGREEEARYPGLEEDTSGSTDNTVESFLPPSG
jgi:hypothetical protein